MLSIRFPPPLSQRPPKRGLLESIKTFFHPPDDAKLGLKPIGCSSSEYDIISYGEARNFKFNWLSVFAAPAALGLATDLIRLQSGPRNRLGHRRLCSFLGSEPNQVVALR
jgi:hypothetical protein